MRGLRTKIQETYNATSICNYDIIALSETWLSDDISSSELISNNYVVYRSDRNFESLSVSRGGGVLLSIVFAISIETLPVDFA